MFAFDKVLDPITIIASQELSLTLGTKTLVQLTGTSSFHFFGLAQVGGNLDGAVVTFVNVSNGAGTKYTFDHESASASSAANRFRGSSGGSFAIGFFYGGLTVRYDAVVSRWIVLGHT